MILVLTNPRTASTWLCNQLADKHNYENLEECFHTPNYRGRHQEYLDYVVANPNTIVKVHAEHFHSDEIDNLVTQLIDIAEHVYFLVRRNYNAQLKSFYIADYMSDFIQDWSAPFDSEKRIVFRERRFNQLNENLQNNIKLLSSVYKMLDHNSTLLYTEDCVKEHYNPVPRPVTWSKPPPTINFNPEPLFKE